MVIKGNARGGAGSLAAHLQRTDTNEIAEIRELRGVAAEDLDGALSEIEAVASGARSRRPFYHASINTRADEVLTPEQWLQAIDRLEQELDLTGQPRAVVAHVKEGRAHVHIAWSRIDLETMKAIPDSHNYRRHEIVARELEKEFGHVRVQGAHIQREGEPRPERTPTHAEMQQAERTGLTPDEAKAQLTEIWNRTDSGKAFAAAIADTGWTLARGDKRDFVLLDPGGEAHSLARRIEGAKAKDIRARMADVSAATLPSVEEARSELSNKRQVAEITPPRLAELGSPPTPVAVEEIDQRDSTEPDAKAEKSFARASSSEGGMVAQQRLANMLVALHWALKEEPEEATAPPRNAAAVGVATAADGDTDPRPASPKPLGGVESSGKYSSAAGDQSRVSIQPPAPALQERPVADLETSETSDHVETIDASLAAWISDAQSEWEEEQKTIDPSPLKKGNDHQPKNNEIEHDPSDP